MWVSESYVKQATLLSVTTLLNPVACILYKNTQKSCKILCFSCLRFR